MGLAVIYSVVTPPLEAGDESRHYAVVKYMADNGRLIVQNQPETLGLQHHWSHEGNQPPLYYALAAGLTFWIDDGEWDEVFWYNPHTSIGDPLRADNKNITIHPPGDGWPWRGHVLAVHLIRFLSIAMAAVTVGVSYAIALSLFKGDRWLAAGAMAVTAFNPMFIFISASINNDNAVILFVTLALWLMVQMATGDWRLASEQRSTVNGQRSLITHHSSVNLGPPALLGLLIGLGALSKLYAFGLLPIAGLLFFWLAFTERTDHQTPITNDQSLITNLPNRTAWRNFILRSATLGLVFVAVAGWFYVRNALLYDGDLFALGVMRDTAGERQEVPSLATIRAEFEGFRIAYWALFGGVNILADPGIYTLLDWVSLIAAIGVVIFVLKIILSLRTTPYIPRPTSTISLPTLILLLTWYLIMLTGFIAWNITQPAGQGRLMYPAISAISALGVLGLTWWLPKKAGRIVVGGCAVGLFLFAAISPVRYIAPAYAVPPILAEADLPPDLQEVNFTYDDKLRLIGYRLETETIRPAEKLPITLYWEVLAPTEINYSIFIHLLGRQRQVIGQLDSFPGGGKWPTTLLKPGDILADSYQIPIAPQAEFEHAPTRLRVAAGIYDFNEPGRPGKPAVNARNEPVDPIIGSTKLVPWQWPSPPTAGTPVNFIDKVTLLSHELAADQRSLTLNWQVHQPVDTDYTVFIQALDAGTHTYATGFDGPPRQNDYPTSLWAPDEVVVDVHLLDLSNLAPGTYDLVAGLYDPATGERLPASTADGPVPNYAVNVGQIQVAK